MEKTEPTFVPEWLKSSGGLTTTSHQFTSSSFNSGEKGVTKSARNKSLDKDLGRTSFSDRTTSSYFRRASTSNGSANLRSYRSFNRNHRDNRDNRDWDKYKYEFRTNKEKLENRHHSDYSDPLSNILPNRFEKDGLRRSHSSLSGKRNESWPKKVASGLNNGSKESFERDFPSLEKQTDIDIGRLPSLGLSSAIQSLPIGSSAVIGGDGWTSALAEVLVIVGNNGNGTSIVQPVQSTLISATTNMTGGRNMAETLARGPLKTQTAPQLNVGTQRLEELAVKQSRQLIPMTPFMPKALALNASDKPKLKIGQSQLQSCHLISNPHTPRPVTVKPDVSKTSTVGKLLVLKPSRERNNGTAKESLSPTSGSKLPNDPSAVPLVAAPFAPFSKPDVVTLEKRPSLQAQSRSNFFNLMRKKSITTNSSSDMVSKKSLYYGRFDGFQSPLVPKAPRSLRVKLNGKSPEVSKLCAFELLADVADKLLQESESSTSSIGQEHKAQITVLIVKQEQPEVKVKVKPLKEPSESDNDSGLGHVSDIKTFDFLKKIESNVKLEPSEIQTDVVEKQSGELTFRESCIDTCVLNKSYSSVNQPIYKHPVSCFMKHRGIIKTGITDDDDNSYTIYPCGTKMSAFRSHSRVGYRRIRKMLTSRYCKVNSMKDYKRSNPDSNRMKPFYQNKKNIYKRGRCQIEAASKRTKFFHNNSSNTTYYGNK